MYRESLEIAVDKHRYLDSYQHKHKKKESNKAETEIREERIKLYRELAKKHQPIGWRNR